MHTTRYKVNNYSAPVGVRNIVINPSVCVSVRLSVRKHYLWKRWTDPHEILCADHLWPWFGPLLATLRYVMYFRFMDDVTFGRNGREAGKGWQASATAINYVRDRGGV